MIKEHKEINTVQCSPYEAYNFDSVFSYKHICEAALLCKRNVFWKSSVQNFMRAMHYYCAVLYLELYNNTFKFQETNEFDIRERGKTRHIKSIKIRDRVIQKVLCIYCLLPLFEKTFIYDNCASLKNKGITFAIKRLITMLCKFYRKHENKGFVLRFDFKDYFNSIDHDIALQLIMQKVKDERILKLILDAISIYSNDKGSVGLGLGSELSQFIALLYANSIDHLIKDKFGIKYYIRYMDDGIVICESKEQLEELLKAIRLECEKLHLTINEKKTYIVPINKGFTFLKKRILLKDSGKIIIRISRDTITRMRRKLYKLKNKLDKGTVTLKNIEDAFISWRGIVEQFDTYYTVQRMNSIFKEIYGYIPYSKKERRRIRESSNKRRIKAILDMYEKFESLIDKEVTNDDLL